MRSRLKRLSQQRLVPLTLLTCIKWELSAYYERSLSAHTDLTGAWHIVRRLHSINISAVYYPHMLIGMLGIYRLLFFCLFVGRILVTDILGVGWCRAMKFCRVVDLGVHQIFSSFGEIWPRGLAPLGQKVEKNFGNAYLKDRLRDRAEIL